MQQTLQLIGSLLLTWAAIVGTASVCVHSRVRWRASRMGRHLMAYMAVVAAVLDLGVIRWIFGDSAAFQLLRLVVFVGVPMVMTQRLWLQVAAYREGLAEVAHQEDHPVQPTPDDTVPPTGDGQELPKPS